jgi:predicted HTH transcriptional regulator
MPERYLDDSKSATEEIPKGNNCTLEELVVLRAIEQNPKITQKSLAAAIGKSERTVKTRTANLQEKGYLCRMGGKRNGYWKLIVELS